MRTTGFIAKLGCLLVAAPILFGVARGQDTHDVHRRLSKLRLAVEGGGKVSPDDLAFLKKALADPRMEMEPYSVLAGLILAMAVNRNLLKKTGLLSLLERKVTATRTSYAGIFATEYLGLLGVNARSTQETKSMWGKLNGAHHSSTTFDQNEKSFVAKVLESPADSPRAGIILCKKVNLDSSDRRWAFGIIKSQISRGKSTPAGQYWQFVDRVFSRKNPF